MHAVQVLADDGARRRRRTVVEASERRPLATVQRAVATQCAVSAPQSAAALSSEACRVAVPVRTLILYDYVSNSLFFRVARCADVPPPLRKA